MNNATGGAMKVKIHKKDYELLETVYYADEKHQTLAIPEGFRTDFASIGTLRFFAPIMYAALDNYGKKAAALHDYLYRESNQFTRKEADDIYFRALRREGVARWRAYIFYAGVRIFGHFSYKGNKP